MRTYRLAARDVAAWLRSVGRNEQARRAIHSQALVRFTALRRLAAVGKLAHAVPIYLRRWYAREKPRPLVITGYHQEVLDGIEQTLRSASVRYVRLHASDTDTQRQLAIDAFQRGEADAFVLPILAGGQGVNLSRAADMLAVERVFSPAQMEQMEDRCRRLTSTDPLTVVYLDAASTIDEHIGEILAEKAQLITGIVDGDETGRDRGLVAQLIERILA
jgi:SNF2 family DNA or RNA helicase